MPLKWEYVLQERTGPDEPGVSLRDLKMEEKIGNAHGVRQRSAALTVRARKTVSASPRLVLFLQTRLKGLGWAGIPSLFASVSCRT